jgi:predicted RNase H-like nuclease (RuvC/YqgF family)
MVKRKKYYQRWREQHPLLQMYLDREQYNMIKKLAMESNKTMKDVVLDAINRLVDFEKWKREYELRIAELSRELKSNESMVSQLKAKVDTLKKIVNGVYECIVARKREVCEGVCIDVKDFVHYWGMHTITFDRLVLEVNWNCLKKLGL